MTVAQQPNGQNSDPGTRLVLEELRDLRIELRDDRRRSDQRFEQVMRDSRDDSARRERLYLDTTQTMFREIRSVGLSIVKTLNRHSRLLESIDRKLGVRGNGGRGNGRRS